LREAATAIGARLIGEDVRFDSVSTDSRTLELGALFIALSGQRFDGLRFIGAAKERGAVAAIVEEPDSSQGDLPFLVAETSPPSPPSPLRRSRSSTTRSVNTRNS